ncbi:MAG: pyruvate kinase, partial [SAR86 cluster bacterium]
MQFIRTKIICTAGPSIQGITMLRKLHHEGMNCVRINMSHSNHKEAQKVINDIKTINS